MDHPDSTEVYETSADLFLHRIMGRVCGWIPCEVKSGKLFLSDFDAKISLGRHSLHVLYPGSSLLL